MKTAISEQKISRVLEKRKEYEQHLHIRLPAEMVIGTENWEAICYALSFMSKPAKLVANCGPCLLNVNHLANTIREKQFSQS